MSDTVAKSNRLIYSILAIQLFDILIHTAVDRVEPLRISGNVVILVWLAMVLFKKDLIKSWMSYLASGIYLLCNSWFIVGDQVFTYFTGQELVVMFALILSTIVLIIIQQFREKAGKPSRSNASI